MRFLFVLAWFLYLLSIPSGSKADEWSEYQLKAAFVYKFTKFIHWPESSQPGDTIKICISGKSPVNQYIKEMEGGASQNKLVKTELITSPKSLAGCHVLFLGQIKQTIMEQLLSGARTHHILTVSDADGFTANRGMIQLFVQGKNIRFSIHRGEAERAGLKINAFLLNLSDTVYNDE